MAPNVDKIYSYNRGFLKKLSPLKLRRFIELTPLNMHRLDHFYVETASLNTIPINQSASSLEDDSWWRTRSNLTQWYLKVCQGRQTWHYCKDSGFQQSFIEKYHLGCLTKEDMIESGLCKRISNVQQQRHPSCDNVKEAVQLGLQFYRRTQTEDGHFAGDYSGPMFLLPGFVIVMYITRTLEEVLSIQHRKEIVYYLKTHICTEFPTMATKNTSNPEGWGLHIEGPPTMLGTCLNYVALRLMGVPSTEPFMQRAQVFIRKYGGAEYIPSWGKFYLAVLNIYEWEGMTPVPPELWMLPHWLPIHPSKIWCHCRQVYLPMSYMYGSKSKAPLDPLLLRLRSEIYNRPYEEIDWEMCQFRVAPTDSYAPAGKLCKSAFFLLNIFEKWLRPTLGRKAALRKTIDHIRAEDQNTNCIGIGPVSKIMDMLVIYYTEGSASELFKTHVHRILDYLWLAADGLKVQGTNGSQLWDTAFFVQALYETRQMGCFKEHRDMVLCARQCLSYLDVSQIVRNMPERERYYRHMSKGGWSFSTRDCGWIVSDCTAEGLKAVLLLQKEMDYDNDTAKLSDDRLFDAVNTLLSLQNNDGGYATYETKRASPYLEYLNPSEVFGKIN